MNVSPIPKVLLIGVMLATAWVGLSPLFNLPATAPGARIVEGRFSAARAMADLAVIAVEPRPSGSSRALTVRDYLVQTIAGLGLVPELQDATLDDYNPDLGLYTHAIVHNVLARLPGDNHTHAVLVSGHYDSAPTSTGASDCGSCAVVALEMLRTLQAGPPLDYDVIFLFTDGEELGMQGAKAFINQHPWAKDVAVSLVLEGLGSGGPSMLYAVTPGNGQSKLIQTALTSLPSRLASSFVNDLMWRVGGNSGSDLDALQPGLGLASIGDQTTDHSMRDTLANMDARAIQSQGDNAVALARQFAGQDLAALRPQPDQIFFTLAPGTLVVYPSSLAIVPVLFAAAGLVALLVRGRRGPIISIRDWLKGVLAWGIGLLGVVVIVTLAWWVIRLTNRNLHAYLMGVTHQSNGYLIALLGLGLAVCGGVYHGLFRRAHLFNLSLGALTWWIIAGLLAAVLMPGASYLFAWPPLIALAVMAWLMVSKSKSPLLLALVLALPAGAAFILFAPAVWLLNVFAGRMESITGLPLMALPVVLAVWVIGLILPQLSFITDRSRRPVIAIAGLLIFVAAAAYAGTQAGFDLNHPRPNTVIYQQDVDAHTASWISVDDSRMGRGTAGQRDEWTRQFIQSNAQTINYNPWSVFMPGDWPALRTGASVVDLPRPVITLTAEGTAEASGRRVYMTMSWPDGAYDGLVSVTTGGPIVSATLNGAGLRLGATLSNRLTLAILNPPEGAIRLALTTTAGPTTVQAQVRRFGLPDIPGQPISPRYGWMMPAPFSKTADSSIVITSRQLP